MLTTLLRTMRAVPGERDGPASRLAILRVLLKLRNAGGPPPSWEELAAEVGQAETTVRYHCRVLRKDGLVSYRDRRYRTLMLTPAGESLARGED